MSEIAGEVWKDECIEDEKCYYCNEKLMRSFRVVFINRTIQSFPYMPHNKSCHMECYIEEVIIGYMERNKCRK